MFEKGKKFVKEHKVEIIVGGCILAAGVVIGAKLNAKMNAEVITLGKKIQFKNWMWWDPQGGSITLDQVKNLMDANVDSGAAYGIIRQEINPTEYIFIKMDENLIIPEAF